MTTIIHGTVRPDWQDHLRRAGAALAPYGDFELQEICKPNMRKLGEAIHKVRPAAIISHSFSTQACDLTGLAKANRHIAFCQVNHSSFNHTLTAANDFEREAQAVRLSDGVPNLWHASPDAHFPWSWFGHRRYRHWPNPIYLPPYTPPPEPPIPCVVVSSRPDVIKALPAQIAAAAIIQRETGCRVVLSLRDKQHNRYRDAIRCASACGLMFETSEWMSPDRWYDFLQREVTLVFQPSLSESFNYISIDAASVGRPFVGSHAIRHTPFEWCVHNPNDPREIASVARYIMSNYQEEQTRARPLAEEVAARNNERYAAVMNEILASATTQKRRR